MDPTTVPRAAIEAATEAATAVVIQCPFWVDGCRCRDGAHNDDAQMAASLAAAAPLLVAAERARLVALAGSNGLAANRLRGLTADLVGATAERDLDQVQKIWPIWFEVLDTLLAAHGAAVERARGERDKALRSVIEATVALADAGLAATLPEAERFKLDALRTLLDGAPRRPDA